LATGDKFAAAIGDCFDAACAEFAVYGCPVASAAATACAATTTATTGAASAAIAAGDYR
jgi:hypothetical protein